MLPRKRTLTCRHFFFPIAFLSHSVRGINKEGRRLPLLPHPYWPDALLCISTIGDFLPHLYRYDTLNLALLATVKIEEKPYESKSSFFDCLRLLGIRCQRTVYGIVGSRLIHFFRHHTALHRYCFDRIR
jgi:hypothetical protein